MKKKEELTDKELIAEIRGARSLLHISHSELIAEAVSRLLERNESEESKARKELEAEQIKWKWNNSLAYPDLEEFANRYPGLLLDNKFRIEPREAIFNQTKFTVVDNKGKHSQPMPLTNVMAFTAENLNIPILRKAIKNEFENAITEIEIGYPPEEPVAILTYPDGTKELLYRNQDQDNSTTQERNV